jgi:hypothetical protein
MPPKKRLARETSVEGSCITSWGQLKEKFLTNFWGF